MIIAECPVIVNELASDRSQRIIAHHSLAPQIHTLLPPTYTQIYHNNDDIR